MQEWTSGEIREFRNHLQMTRARFGEMIGVSTNYVYMLEKGLRIPSKTLRILLDHLKKSKEKEVPTRD
ncbi:MAG TPA: helix-turn-helix transcriptional regulator [Thermoanaerobaculia bacterium]|nr:helix-turn-helix transcriptional regulator [Thermoanaerobaculia bacterium]HUM30795.1 helix-turn-helix transcriptional regulator [Thermoanaerobaculia bacterium]HXK69005.1 helix-turn-helix transcriptional regulator [Thermoanaerobaculia bacterium]